LSQVPQDWGICMAGNGEAFCRGLDTAYEGVDGAHLLFEYVEVGIGYCQTLSAVGEYLAAVNRGIFHLHAVDVPWYCTAPIPGHRLCPIVDQVTFHLTGSRRFFQDTRLRASFIFIDGCHGEKCVAEDFIGASRILRPGGVIAFHDTCEKSQGQDFQPHCKTGISVREAVRKLGLLDGSRAGWKKLEETQGGPPDGRGMLFVQKNEVT